jgi:predicted deacylase
MKKMKTIDVGNLSVKQGEMKLGKLDCGYLPDSSVVSIPLLVASGLEAGPVLLLTAAMHGPELTGVEVIRRILREKLDPKELSGAVIAAPILNPFGYQHASMLTPQDGYNLNRVFPGDPETLLTHRLAHTITTQLLAKADYLIDYHANPRPAMQFSIIKEGKDKQIWRKCREMAEAFGITTVEAESSYETHRAGMIGEWAAEQGKPNITLELLHWRQIDESSVKTGVRGTLNIMKYLKMIEGDMEPQEGVTMISGGPMTRKEVTADKGGLITYHKQLGEPIAKGEVIAVIRDPWGDIVEEIESPVDGWVLAWPYINFQAAATGDLIVMILCPRE